MPWWNAGSGFTGLPSSGSPPRDSSTRGKTIPLPSVIEDVARAPGAVCRVVSDERIVEVEGDFCEPSERDWLRDEIRRLLIEFGTRADVAGSSGVRGDPG